MDWRAAQAVYEQQRGGAAPRGSRQLLLGVLGGVHRAELPAARGQTPRQRRTVVVGRRHHLAALFDEAEGGRGQPGGRDHRPGRVGRAPGVLGGKRPGLRQDARECRRRGGHAARLPPAPLRRRRHLQRRVGLAPAAVRRAEGCRGAEGRAPRGRSSGAEPGEVQSAEGAGAQDGLALEHADCYRSHPAQVRPQGARGCPWRFAWRGAASVVVPRGPGVYVRGPAQQRSAPPERPDDANDAEGPPSAAHRLLHLYARWQEAAEPRPARRGAAPGGRPAGGGPVPAVHPLLRRQRAGGGQRSYNGLGDEHHEGGARGGGPAPPPGVGHRGPPAGPGGRRRPPAQALEARDAGALARARGRFARVFPQGQHILPLPARGGGRRRREGGGAGAPHDRDLPQRPPEPAGFCAADPHPGSGRGEVWLAQEQVQGQAARARAGVPVLAAGPLQQQGGPHASEGRRALRPGRVRGRPVLLGARAPEPDQ
mmetsp:Transcript_11567/g.30939  ORF Transcript_11567/g.30939 Transcript_11567/m.30939 type:complete len:482 (+) Transcript_11567:512-1957(+)